MHFYGFAVLETRHYKGLTYEDLLWGVESVEYEIQSFSYSVFVPGEIVDDSATESVRRDSGRSITRSFRVWRVMNL